MFRFAAVLLVLGCLPGLALAEGRCPPGYYPSLVNDYMGCAPVYDASGAGDEGEGDSGPAPERPQWLSRFGAIAADRETGHFAGVENLTTPIQARDAAIGACRRNGGSASCKVIAEYADQCGVLAYGMRSYVAFSGTSQPEIIEHSLRECSKLTEDCQIFYLGCSAPVPN